jgi:hypothetical protein
MKLRGIAWLGLVAAGVLLLTSPTSTQGSKWWQSDAYVQELGLTRRPERRESSRSISRTAPALRRYKDTLDKAEADFNQMVEASDDTQVMAQVTVVETARSELNKARTMMLLRMRRGADARPACQARRLATEDRRSSPRRRFSPLVISSGPTP